MTGCLTSASLKSMCLCRSTAAESYLKDEIWHVPDKPAVPVGEWLGHSNVLHAWEDNMAVIFLPVYGSSVSESRRFVPARCDWARCSVQPRSVCHTQGQKVAEARSHTSVPVNSQHFGCCVPGALHGPLSEYSALICFLNSVKISVKIERIFRI